MEKIFSMIIGIVLSYLIGCICTGHYLTKLLKKQNPKEIGSGGLGATNISRVLGKKGFIITFTLDFLKGILVAYTVRILELDVLWVMIFGFMAIIGHIYPFQLNFSGGKGISTFLGVMIIFDYNLVLIYIITFGFSYLIFRRFVMGGLFTILLTPAIIYILGYPYIISLTSILLIGIIFMAHKENIKEYFLKNSNIT